jgi:hypothetical protein
MANKCTIPKTYQIVKPREVEDHLAAVLGINLNDHLDFSKSTTLKTFALVPPLLVLYHYAKAVNFKLQVRDMMASGHKSHCMGSELDFWRSPSSKGKKVAEQAPIIVDLLKLRDKMKPSLNSFRLGFYFDRFDTTTHAKDYATFLKAYKSKKLSPIHLGVTYRWNHVAAVAKYATVSQPAAKFGFWGRGSENFGKQRFWEKKLTGSFKENGKYIGHLNDQKIVDVRSAVLHSFRCLEVPYLLRDTRDALLHYVVPSLYHLP